MVDFFGTYSHQGYVLERLAKVLAVPHDRRHETRKHRQKQVRLAEADQQRMIEAYGRLRSVYAVAHEFGIRRQTVAAILERHGVKRRYRILGNRQVSKAKRMYEAGDSLVTIGKQLRVDPQTVRSVLLKAGVKMRPVGTNQW